MSVIATALKHLMAAGVTGDALIEAISEIEAALPGAQPAEPPRSKAAIRQERYRRNKASQNVTSNAERNTDPLPLPPNDNNSNPPTPTPGNITPAREAADAHVTDWLAWREKNPFPRPHWAPAPLWADFKKNRKAKKLVSTVAAHDRLLRDIEAACKRTGWPPGRIFRACVEQGWGAIYDTNEMKAAINGNGSGNRNGAPGHHGGRDNRDGFKRACDDLIAQAERSPAGGDGGDRQLALGGPGPL